jgi:hypothetical protein
MSKLLQRSRVRELIIIPIILILVVFSAIGVVSLLKGDNNSINSSPIECDESIDHINMDNEDIVFNYLKLNKGLHLEKMDSFSISDPFEMDSLNVYVIYNKDSIVALIDLYTYKKYKE